MDAARIREEGGELKAMVGSGKWHPKGEQAGAGNPYQPVACSELSVARTLSLLATLALGW